MEKVLAILITFLMGVFAFITFFLANYIKEKNSLNSNII